MLLRKDALVCEFGVFQARIALGHPKIQNPGCTCLIVKGRPIKLK